MSMEAMKHKSINTKAFLAIRRIVLAIVALVSCAELPLAVGRWTIEIPRESAEPARITVNLGLFSPWSHDHLRPSRLCRAASGSGRMVMRVRTTDRRHWQSCRARPFCPSHTSDEEGQKCLNSVGQFWNAVP